MNPPKKSKKQKNVEAVHERSVSDSDHILNFEMIGAESRRLTEHKCILLNVALYINQSVINPDITLDTIVSHHDYNILLNICSILVQRFSKDPANEVKVLIQLIRYASQPHIGEYALIQAIFAHNHSSIFEFSDLKAISEFNSDLFKKIVLSKMYSDPKSLCNIQNNNNLSSSILPSLLDFHLSGCSDQFLYFLLSCPFSQAISYLVEVMKNNELFDVLADLIYTIPKYLEILTSFFNNNELKDILKRLLMKEPISFFSSYYDVEDRLSLTVKEIVLELIKSSTKEFKMFLQMLPEKYEQKLITIILDPKHNMIKLLPEIYKRKPESRLKILTALLQDNPVLVFRTFGKETDEVEMVLESFIREINDIQFQPDVIIFYIFNHQQLLMYCFEQDPQFVHRIIDAKREKSFVKKIAKLLNPIVHIVESYIERENIPMPVINDAFNDIDRNTRFYSAIHDNNAEITNFSNGRINVENIQIRPELIRSMNDQEMRHVNSNNAFKEDDVPLMMYNISDESFINLYIKSHDRINNQEIEFFQDKFIKLFETLFQNPNIVNFPTSNFINKIFELNLDSVIEMINDYLLSNFNTLNQKSLKQWSKIIAQSSYLYQFFNDIVLNNPNLDEERIKSIRGLYIIHNYSYLYNDFSLFERFIFSVSPSDFYNQHISILIKLYTILSHHSKKICSSECKVFYGFLRFLSTPEIINFVPKSMNESVLYIIKGLINKSELINGHHSLSDYISTMFFLVEDPFRYFEIDTFLNFIDLYSKCNEYLAAIQNNGLKDRFDKSIIQFLNNNIKQQSGLLLEEMKRFGCNFVEIMFSYLLLLIDYNIDSIEYFHFIQSILHDQDIDSSKAKATLSFIRAIIKIGRSDTQCKDVCNELFGIIKVHSAFAYAVDELNKEKRN